MRELANWEGILHRAASSGQCSRPPVEGTVDHLLTLHGLYSRLSSCSAEAAKLKPAVLRLPCSSYFAV